MSSFRISVLADACSTMRLISSRRLARSAATAADQDVERAETGQQTAGNSSCSVGPSHGTAQLSIPLPPQDAANRSHHMQQVIVLKEQHSRIFIVKIHRHSQEQQPPAAHTPCFCHRVMTSHMSNIGSAEGTAQREVGLTPPYPTPHLGHAAQQVCHPGASCWVQKPVPQPGVPACKHPLLLLQNASAHPLPPGGFELLLDCCSALRIIHHKQVSSPSTASCCSYADRHSWVLKKLAKLAKLGFACGT
jgi:hypothetical protein